MSPKRLLTFSFYRRHRLTIAYVALCLAIVALYIDARHRSSDLRQQARNGALAHRALCAQRDQLNHGIRQAEEFLRLTPAQRVRRYGPLLGSVPPSTIRASLIAERRTVAAYEDLGC